jgi:hypothetical protein
VRITESPNQVRVADTIQSKEQSETRDAVRYLKASLTPCKEKFAGVVGEIKKYSEQLEKEFTLESHRSRYFKTG